MASWSDVEASEPEFARAVRDVFDANKHKTIATLRADGSPRLSGLELGFEAGEVVFGMMPASRKRADVRRDPRTEIHSASIVPEGDDLAWKGDARLSGRVREVTDPAEHSRFTADPPEAYPLFVLEIERVVRIALDGSPPHLLIQTWRPDRPLESAFAD